MEKVCFSCFKQCSGRFCGHCGYEQGTFMKKYTLALPEGSVLSGRFIVGRVLGQGGFGITYVAQDFQTKKLVAIKEFFPDSFVTRTSKVNVVTISDDRRENFEYGKECFLKEAETLSKLSAHPNIVRIYSYFEENNTAYLAMEYLDGESLWDHLRKRGKISWSETRMIVEPVMDALEFVHSKGLIHRDISPDNIFICKDGTVKLIDFGAARYSLGNRSQSLSVVLKHGFAPMEQYTRRGRQGPYTDVYALASTMYRAATGQSLPEAPERLYEKDSIQWDSFTNEIPEQDKKALSKALAFNYPDRWQSISEFREAMTNAVYPKPEPIPETVKVDSPAIPETVYVGDDEDEAIKKPSVLKAENSKPKRKGKALLSAIGLILGVIAVTFIAIFAVVVMNNSKNDNFTSDTNSKKLTVSDSTNSAAPYSDNSEIETVLNQNSKDQEKWDKNNTAKYDGITYRLNADEVEVISADEKIKIAVIKSVIDGYPVTKISKDAFYGLERLQSVTIPESLIKIYDFAFSHCESLTTINIPNSVKYIGKGAFSFTKISETTIPSSVISIGGFPFEGCLNLKKIHVQDGNKNFCSIDNNLYNKDKTELIQYAIGKTDSSFSIPNGVKKLYYTFYGCKNLTSVSIPDSLENIGEGSFEECENLNKVNIPNSVKKIGRYAFLGCNLESISLPSGCNCHPDAFDDDVEITIRYT